MFERFTHAARTAVTQAQEEARRRGAPAIGTEHLLLGVLADVDGAPAVVLARHGIDAVRVAEACRATPDLDDEALASLGIDLDEVRRRAEDAFGPGALDEPRPVRERRGLLAAHVPFTAGAKRALAQAVRAATFHHDREIGSAQLFLGLLTDEDVVLILHRLGSTATTEELVSAVRERLDRAA